MSRRSALVRAAAALALTTLVGACASPGRQGAPGRGASIATVAARGHPPIAVAVREGRDLGPVAADAVLRLSFGLAERDPRGLDAILDAGLRVTPGEYAARFGADPRAVSRLRSTLASLGARTRWSAGATTLDVWMTAAAIRAEFGVSIDRFIGPDGTRFRAPTAPAAAGGPSIVPAAWRPLVTSVSGFDDYPNVHGWAIPSRDGVSPKDMIAFYDAGPLRSAGLDGTGQTIYFLEIDRFGQAGLDAYARKFGLPAFHPTVVSNPAWGTPQPEGAGPSETDLDLEIAHAIAPGARLVVYDAGNDQRFDVAMRDLLRAHPGAIVSVSIGQCEPFISRGVVSQDAAAVRAAAGEGASIFVSTGDRGAYGCIPSGDIDTVATNYLSSFPEVTGVGGTTVFFSSSGGYFREAAWGEPAEQWGSGGGISSLFPVPPWQRGPGIDPSAKGRGSPDVSANADALTGWDVFGTDREVPVGGTSAAAPFWAAVTALIDQDLAKQGLQSVGFANPDLYRFAQSPAGLPSPAFHDITAGTNLLYPATAGWDYATGLGTPDVAALADDFEWARRRS